MPANVVSAPRRRKKERRDRMEREERELREELLLTTLQKEKGRV